MFLLILSAKFCFFIAIFQFAFVIIINSFKLEFCYKGHHFLTSAKNCFQINDLTFEQKWTNQLKKQMNQTTSLDISYLKLSESNYLTLLSHPFPNLKKIKIKTPKESDSFQIQQNYNVLTPKLVQKIFTSKYFQQLESLELSRTYIQFRHFEFLQKLDLKIQSNLKHLILSKFNSQLLEANYLEKRAFQLLSKIDFNGKLQTLELAGNSLIEPSTIQSVLKIILPREKQSKSNLKKLDLHLTSISTDNLIELLKNIGTKNLQYLDIAYHAFQHSKNYNIPFNNSLFEYLSSCDFSSLKSLNLSHLDLDEEQLHYLKKMRLPSLENLEIGNNFVTDDYFREWIKSENLPQLKTLNITQNSITDEAIKLLVEEDFLKLSSLDISKNKKLSPNHLKFLQTINSSRLIQLDISGNSANEESLRCFFQNRSFSHLEELKMEGYTTGKSLFKYLDWKSMIKLRSFELIGTDISNSFQTIQKDSVSFPNLKVWRYGGQWLRKNTMDDFLNKLAFFAPQLQFYQVKISGFERNGGYFNFSHLVFDNIPKNTILKSPGFMTIYKPPKGNKFQLIELYFIQRYHSFDKKELAMQNVSFFGGPTTPQTQDVQGKNQIKNKNAQPIFKFLYNFLYFRNLEAAVFIYPMYFAEFLKHILEQDLRYSLGKLEINEPVPTIKNSVYLPYFRYFSYRWAQALEYDNSFLEVWSKLQAPLLHFVMFISESNKKNLNFTKEANKILSKHHNINVVKFIDSKINCGELEQIFEGVNFSFLVALSIYDSEIQSECLEKVVSRHRLIKQLFVYNNNELSEGLSEILIKHELILDALDIGSCQLGDEGFSKLSKLNRQFLLMLQAKQNQLTSNGIKWLAENCTSQNFLFPRILDMNLDSNFFDEQGPKYLFLYGLPLAQRLIFWAMTDMSVNNLFLQYPKRFNFTNILIGHLDQLEQKFDKRALRHVETLRLDSPYAYFEAEDFRLVAESTLHRIRQLHISVKDVYECEVYHHLLKIVKYTESLKLQLSYSKNSGESVKDDCLQKYSNQEEAFMYHLRRVNVSFPHDQIYIPKFYAYIYSTNFVNPFLDIIEHELTDQNMSYIFKRLELEEEVMYIDLRRNFLTDVFLQELFRRPLEKVRLLNMNSNYIELKNVKSLIGKTFPLLQFLFLGVNYLTDESIDLIVKAHYPKLFEISLEGNSISLKGLLKLIDLDAPLLKTIYLTSTLITEQDLIYILQYGNLERFPDLTKIQTNVKVQELNSRRIQTILTKKFKQNLKVTYIKSHLPYQNKATLQV